MYLESYRYTEDSGWDFSIIKLHKVNLFVGATGSGKSRLLNTIFNLGLLAIGKLGVPSTGKWELTFRDGDRVFEWHMSTFKEQGSEKGVITSERLSISAHGKIEEIYNRQGSNVVFRGAKLPALSSSNTGIFLFREEELIRPIHEWLSRLLFRRFYQEELSTSCTYDSLPKSLEAILVGTKSSESSHDDLYQIFSKFPLSTSSRLHVIKRRDATKFYLIMRLFQSVFPTIEKCDVADATELKLNAPAVGFTPIFYIKEKGVNNLIHLQELSSGMQKVLLIMTDIISFPEKGAYLIDEFENSLGVNAISFLPELLSEYDGEGQFILTTHHPYLINNIPIESWHIFHRKGSRVEIKPGVEFAEKFSASKQTAFTKLINDPFYAGGSE